MSLFPTFGCTKSNDMFDKEEAIIANGILHGLLATSNGIDTQTIFEAREHSFKTLAHLNRFVENMYNNAHEYFEFENLNGVPIIHLKANEFTEDFLEGGGFVTLHEEIVKTNRKQLEDAIKEKDYQKLHGENLLLTTKLNKQRLKTHWIPIVVSFISLAFAAYSLLKPSNSISQDVLDTKVESL